MGYTGNQVVLKTKSSKAGANPMLTTLTLLDMLKKGPKGEAWTEYRVAKELEISHTTIGNWKKRGSIMNDDIGVKVAELLGLPEDLILLSLACERKKNTVAEPLFKRLAEEAEKAAKKGKTAAAALLVGLLAIGETGQNLPAIF